MDDELRPLPLLLGRVGHETDDVVTVSEASARLPFPVFDVELGDFDSVGLEQRLRPEADRLAVVHEIDPLLCRYCGAEMRIVAFAVEVSSLRRLLEGVGDEPQEAEPSS